MRRIRGLLPMLDSLVDDAPNDGWTQWVYGAVTPILLGVYAASIYYSGFVTLGRRMQRFQLHGTPAYCLAGAAISFALLLHCRNFWSNTRRLAEWSELGVLISLMATVACLIGFVVTSFAPF